MAFTLQAAMFTVKEKTFEVCHLFEIGIILFDLLIYLGAYPELSLASVIKLHSPIWVHA